MNRKPRLEVSEGTRFFRVKEGSAVKNLASKSRSVNMMRGLGSVIDSGEDSTDDQSWVPRVGVCGMKGRVGKGMGEGGVFETKVRNKDKRGSERAPVARRRT